MNYNFLQQQTGRGKGPSYPFGTPCRLHPAFVSIGDTMTLDRSSCFVCGGAIRKESVGRHKISRFLSHHVVWERFGGVDDDINRAILCDKCHSNLHKYIEHHAVVFTLEIKPSFLVDCYKAFRELKGKWKTPKNMDEQFTMALALYFQNVAPKMVKQRSRKQRRYLRL